MRIKTIICWWVHDFPLRIRNEFWLTFEWVNECLNRMRIWLVCGWLNGLLYIQGEFWSWCIDDWIIRSWMSFYRCVSKSLSWMRIGLVWTNKCMTRIRMKWWIRFLCGWEIECMSIQDDDEFWGWCVEGCDEDKPRLELIFSILCNHIFKCIGL